jgi:hypothetical protein
MVGAWFSPGTPASSTTKTGHHDIAEILLKVALNTKNQIKSNPYCCEQKTNVDSLVVFVCLNRFLKLTKPGANPRRSGDRLV